MPPPGVKRIKQKTVGLLARYEGFLYVLKKGYDLIISSDSHVWSTEPPYELEKKAREFGWASACIYHTYENIPIGGTVCYSFMTIGPDGPMWCVIPWHEEPIPITNEPVIAYTKRTLELIIDKYAIFYEYGLDHLALLYTDPGGLIKTKFTHILFPRKREFPKDFSKLYEVYSKFPDKLKPRGYCRTIYEYSSSNSGT